eukprot:5873762-Amphidinium_carterae.1
MVRSLASKEGIGAQHPLQALEEALCSTRLALLPYLRTVSAHRPLEDATGVLTNHWTAETEIAPLKMFARKGSGLPATVTRQRVGFALLCATPPFDHVLARSSITDLRAYVCSQ